MKKTRRAFHISQTDGEGTTLEISKVTMVKMDQEMIHLDKLKDGTWRLIYSEKVIPDITKLKSFDMIREG
tara:strand:- start:30 stop:239 length:210 start_codon:yes stop_codon:yes gene_type:complete